MHERDSTPSTGSLSETRNSPLRKLTSSGVENIAQRLHDQFPQLSPTHLNVLGAVGVALGSHIVSQRSKESAERIRQTSIAGAVLTSSVLLDSIDGQLARTIDSDRKSKVKVDMQKGQLYDILVDRTQEFTMARARAKQAAKQGNTIGSTAALLNAVTTALPGIGRAHAESKGTAVPEVGKNPLTMLGSRPIRASLGIAATLFPEVKDVPTQVIADAIMIAGNVSNAVDRYQRSRNGKATLSKKDQALGTERRNALLLFEGIAIGAALYMYLQIREDKQSPQKNGNTESDPNQENDYYQLTLARIEEYCQTHNLDHRFVGGTLTDLIGPQTEYDIDIQERSVSLRNPNQVKMSRSDGSIKDIDLVLFTKDHEAFKNAQEEFNNWAEEAKAQGLPVPNISAEAARYSDWPARNKWKQFVSSFEVDENGQLHLTFGNISQPISKDTIEPWKVKLPNGQSITTFHPFAHALCYMLRVPSGVKKKDKEIHVDPETQARYNKVNLLMHLAKATKEKGGEKEWKRYADWIAYTQNIHLHPDLPTRVKGTITGKYWDTIGTQVSHGVGLFGRLSTLSDRMNG